MADGPEQGDPAGVIGQTSFADLILGVRRHGNKRPNDVDFRLGEWTDAGPSHNEPPEQWVRRIIRRRFTKAAHEEQFSSDADLARACKKIGRDWGHWVGPKTAQQARVEQLQAVDDSNLPAAASLLLAIRRGYDQAEAVDRAAQIDQERQDHLATIRQYLRVTRQRLRTQRVRRAAHRRFRFQQNEETLVHFRDELRQLDPAWEARCQLGEAAATVGWGGLIETHSLDRALRGLRLRRLDPALIEFPFRFLVHLPVSSYQGLFDLWDDGRSQDAILDSLSPKVLQSGFVDRIIVRSNEGPFSIGNERAQVLQELHDLVRHPHLQATAAIAVSQSEGLIWAYAHHLTRRGIRICKRVRSGRRPKYSPYVWNPATRNYRDLDASTGRPHHQVGRACKHASQCQAPGGCPWVSPKPVFVTSGRQLIERTALQRVLSIELWDWLLDGFFDERNSIMHGEMVVDQRMATKAVLALLEIVHSINDFEAIRLSDDEWRHSQ